MTLLLLYISTAVIFLAADALVLPRVVKPLFDRHLGDELLSSIRFGPAALFYLFFVFVIIWLVTAPVLDTGLSSGVVLNAALLGAAAYGTYEFTNYATLKSWHWQMVAVDFVWGTVLTTVSAVGGLWITRALIA